ncbi:MAG TPA: alpha/beta fold hydrolase [Chitinophagaceae bacterium]|nr:alpha/beta fold hydrolase [Chitinophagaceae bacterium]
MLQNIIMSLALLLTGLTQGYSQYNPKFTGTWEGKLNVGVELRLVFHIEPDGKGGYNSTADSPDQSAYGIPCSNTSVKGDALKIEMNSLSAEFSGLMTNDSTIDGIFTQGREFPLQLKKVEKVSERKRPQTPQPPFPYKTEEIEYSNKSKSLSFGATLTIPNGKGPYPSAILITGSGPQNRDEELFGHKPFAVLADHLTRNGYLVLRADDRGTGKSTGKFNSATSADFTDDVIAALDYLATRPEVNRKKMGLIGHSEGGMIAPIVASRRKDIDFIVLLAAPGIKTIDLMTEQNEAILESAGMSDSAVKVYSPLYRHMINQVLQSRDTIAATVALKNSLDQWVDSTDPRFVNELGLTLAESRESMAKGISEAMSLPWFKYFLAFDPAPYLQKLSAKVLAINGDKDLQVISKSNLAGIETALKKSKSKIHATKEMNGLNHLFQTCKKCNLEEYGQLEETISPLALQTITDWLNSHVK